MTEGFLYIVWGGKHEALLQRSIASVKRWHPDLPVHVERPDGSLGLRHKTAMGRYAPFDVIVYLDADTVVLGDLKLVFEKAQLHGIACTIAECPWMRRYDWPFDNIEYSTGVVGMRKREIHRNYKTDNVLYDFEKLWEVRSSSRWIDREDGCQLKGLDYEDQAAFSHAIMNNRFNPYVLPINYNFHPGAVWDRAFFPIKVWHSPEPVPKWVEDANARVMAGGPVEFAKVCG